MAISIIGGAGIGRTEHWHHDLGRGGLAVVCYLEPLAMTWIHMAVRPGYGRSFAFARLQR